MTSAEELVGHAMDASSLYMFQHPSGPRYDFSEVTPLSTALSGPDTTIQQITRWELQAAEVYLYYYMKSRDCPQFINPRNVLVDARGDIIHNTISSSRQKNTVLNELVYMNSMIRIHSAMMAFVKTPIEQTTSTQALYVFNLITTYMYGTAVSETDVCGAATLRTVARCMDTIAQDSGFHNLAKALVPEGTVRHVPVQSDEGSASTSSSSSLSMCSTRPISPNSSVPDQKVHVQPVQNENSDLDIGRKLTPGEFPVYEQLRCRFARLSTNDYH